jgi:hypothetical protein
MIIVFCDIMPCSACENLLEGDSKLRGTSSHD